MNHERDALPLPWPAGRTEEARVLLRDLDRVCRQRHIAFPDHPLAHMHPDGTGALRWYGVLGDYLPGIVGMGIEATLRHLDQNSAHGWTALSVTGCRHNEDAFVARGDVFAVLDGTGGSRSGQPMTFAAACALERPGTPYERLHHAEDSFQEVPRGWHRGATVGVAVLEVQPLKVRLGWVGKCRAYRVRGGSLTRLTEDHDLGRQFRETGLPADLPPHFHHLPTQLLCRERSADIETLVCRREPGDVYLLTTSGVAGHDTLSDDDIAGLLLETPDLRTAAVSLAAAAAAYGRIWDRTVVLVRP